MSKDRDRRYASTVEFARALQEAVALDLGNGDDASEVPLRRPGTARPAHVDTVDLETSGTVRRPWRMAVVAFTVVCLASILLNLDPPRAWMLGPRSANAYRKVTDSAARMLARARTAASFTSSARAVAASREVP